RSQTFAELSKLLPWGEIMDGGEQPQAMPPDSFVIATYREIAERFGLGSPDAARVRAKRAKWVREPTNHPLDPARVRVPMTEWEQAIDPQPDRPRTPRRDSSRSQPRSRGIASASSPPLDLHRSDPITAFSDAVAVLREQLERER